MAHCHHDHLYDHKYDDHATAAYNHQYNYYEHNHVLYDYHDNYDHHSSADHYDKYYHHYNTAAPSNYYYTPTTHHNDHFHNDYYKAPHNYHKTSSNHDYHDNYHYNAIHTPSMISCLCPTFARVPLLEEAIESFLRQDYKGEKELIICNDCDKQTLEFNHPEVRVFNVKDRFKTIGEKRNYTASLAKGEILLTWGDDDIHLPGRITRMVNALQGDMVLEGHHYCLNGHLAKNRFPTCGAHAVRAEFYWSLGGLPELTMGEDVGFNNLAYERMGSIPDCREEPQFLYRWSSGRPHLSWGDEHYGKMGQSVDQLISDGQEPSGVYRLNPHWKQDYVEFSKTAISK